MTLWILSAHGSAEMVDHKRNDKEKVQAVELVQIPVGVKFYHCSGEAMVSKPSVADFEFLIMGVQQHGPQTADALLLSKNMELYTGVSIPNYSMHFTSDFGCDRWGYQTSGIFVSGDRHRKHRMAFTPPPGHIMALKHFFVYYTQPGDLVAWMCCRVWHSSARGGFLWSVSETTPKFVPISDKLKQANAY